MNFHSSNRTTKGFSWTVNPIAGSSQQATNSVTIITPLARIRKKGCKKITLVDPKSGPEATEEEKSAELVKKEHEAA